jgi:hypothetical protein
MLITARPAKYPYLLPLGKGLVLLFTLYFLYTSLTGEQVGAEAWLTHLRQLRQPEARWLLLLTVVLIPVNWGLETWKWRALAGKLEAIPYWRAYRGVMTGLCLGFITPNRVGDYAGRILELRTDRRTDAIGAVFLGRVSQMLITLCIGSLGLFYLSARFPDNPGSGGLWLAGILTVALAVALLGGLLYSRLLPRVMGWVRPLRPLKPYLAVLETYSPADIGRVLLISLLRYTVFSVQFGLLLSLFGVRLSLPETVAGVAATYLLKSLLPSFNALGDLGLREVSALYFFSLFGQQHLPVLTASLSLWLLNIAFPAVVGLFFVFRLKLRA